MFSTSRRIMVAVVVAGGLALSTAPAAHAVIDPVGVVGCLTQSSAELIDPAAPGLPAEIPALACLAP
ncbi:hypothetical protein E1295_28325 [Nonomuraea mesophila]|uniref:Uncharacterized protein n=1 Tax=Nonomuraea mesophila TaxID=2530382 RepID=A0A4V2Z8Z1_9ACTN|nr:hypothetical protein [Nonomuraea mesophila]TDE42195.1 hypothetical protein E1295_28325 [Nonomuraea mesophila]